MCFFSQQMAANIQHGKDTKMVQEWRISSYTDLSEACSHVFHMLPWTNMHLDYLCERCAAMVEYDFDEETAGMSVADVNKVVAARTGSTVAPVMATFEEARDWVAAVKARKVAKQEQA